MMVTTMTMRRWSTAPKKVSSSFLSSQAFIPLFWLETDDSEEDMEMDNDDYKVASKGKLKSYEVEYESLSQTAVERLMQRDIDHICGILFVNVRVLPRISRLF
jgi:hypothetical protein